MHVNRLPELAEFVTEVIKDNYPDLKIPYHSRWGHFRAGAPERLQGLFKRIQTEDPLEQARIQLDLVIPSVLLDAGAGPDWTYCEKDTGLKIGRSEGLGIASYYMFLQGGFSASAEKGNARMVRTRPKAKQVFMDASKWGTAWSKARALCHNSTRRW